MFKCISKRKFNKVSQIKEIYKQAYTYSMNANNISFKLAAFLGYLQSIIENDKFLSENYFKILLINKSLAKEFSNYCIKLSDASAITRKDAKLTKCLKNL